MNPTKTLLQELKELIDRHLKTNWNKFEVGSNVNVIINNNVAWGVVESVVAMGNTNLYSIHILNSEPKLIVSKKEDEVAYKYEHDKHGALSNQALQLVQNGELTISEYVEFVKILGKIK